MKTIKNKNLKKLDQKIYNLMLRNYMMNKCTNSIKIKNQYKMPKKEYNNVINKEILNLLNSVCLINIIIN